ncbi:MAG TPA: IPT/TIG domain-containing protein [Solirubrobacteraceae bacterium]|nr:IPT/TIG domain-containing protein [Solirubrobacteraceae bacterium]
MPTIPANVEPGDLITSSFMNTVLAELTSLEGRVSALEAGTVTTAAISITSVSPQPAQAGQNVTIVGTNFGFLEGDYQYTFNGISTPAIRAGSTDTLLTCQVPFLTGLAPGGSQVTLTMYNGTNSTTASTVITVLPATVVLQGTVDTLFESASPDPISAGATTNFTFSLQSRASAAVTLVLTPSVAVTGGGTAFPANMLNAAGQPLANSSVTLNPGDVQSVIVAVAIPAGTSGRNFTLTLAAAGGLASSSGALPFTVGQYASPDTTFIMAPSSSNPATALQGNTITASVSAATIVDVYVEANYTVVGNYNLSLVLPGTSGWTVAFVQPQPAGPAGPAAATAVQAVVQGDIESTGIAPTTIHFRVKPNPGATSPGQLQLVGQLSGATKSRTLPFTLVASA